MNKKKGINTMNFIKEELYEIEKVFDIQIC